MQYLTNANLFAQAYGACTYGDSGYETGTCQAGASSGAVGSSAGGGLLTNTGFDVLLVVTLACTIMFVALIVRFWKRPGRQSKVADGRS